MNRWNFDRSCALLLESTSEKVRYVTKDISFVPFMSILTNFGGSVQESRTKADRSWMIMIFVRLDREAFGLCKLRHGTSNQRRLNFDPTYADPSTALRHVEL